MAPSLPEAMAVRVSDCELQTQAVHSLPRGPLGQLLKESRRCHW